MSENFFNISSQKWPCDLDLWLGELKINRDPVLTKTPVTPEWRPYSVLKMQIAEVRAVQSPATLYARCAIA